MTARRWARIGVALVVGLLAAAATPAAAGQSATISVTPSTDLVDDQVVEVRGEGWPPRRFVLVLQCDARAVDLRGCDESAGSFVKDHDGSFVTEVRVERVIETAAFGTVDCAAAPDACMMGALHRPGRILATAPLSFDPEGPPPDPPFEIDLDLARSVRIAPDGRRAVVDARVACQPGMHVDVWVQLSQDHGEDDVIGGGGEFIRRCHGTVEFEIVVRVFDGGAFQPGHAVLGGDAFGFGGDEHEEEFAHDFELVRASLSR